MQSQIIVVASRKEGKTMMFNDPIDTIDPQLLLKQIHYKEEFILSGATLEDLRKHYTGSVLLWLFEDQYKSGDGKNKIVLEYGEERKYLEGKDLAAGIKCINAPAHLVLLYPDIIGLSHDQGLIRAVAEKKCTLTAARYPGGSDLMHCSSNMQHWSLGI